MRVGGVSTQLGMARTAGMTTMLMPAIAVSNTAGPHAAIESHGPLVWCAAQPERSGVGLCHSALTPTSVDFALDSTAEWFVSDA